MFFIKIKFLFIALVLSIGLVACGSPAPEAPADTVDTSTQTTDTTAVNGVAEVAVVNTEVPPPTWTTAPTQPPPATATTQPTSTPAPPTATFTPLPTNTPQPTETPTPEPTDTPVPTNTAVPAAPAAPQQPAAPAAPVVPDNPVLGGNILPNGSFEGGWYHTNGVGELQTPDSWTFRWDEGPTGYGGQTWDVWVRPEMRVLSKPYLPPAEHELFIFDGQQTIKVFKGAGAISFQLFTEVDLGPGTYVFEAQVFPDLYEDYQEGQKIWASDPVSGEIMLFTNNGNSGWLLPRFGQRNELEYAFTITEPQRVQVGVKVRGRYAIANNGWFMDNWSLRQIEG